MMYYPITNELLANHEIESINKTTFTGKSPIAYNHEIGLFNVHGYTLYASYKYTEYGVKKDGTNWEIETQIDKEYYYPHVLNYEVTR